MNCVFPGCDGQLVFLYSYYVLGVKWSLYVCNKCGREHKMKNQGW